uniref:TIL domain-containing protein n=1 Tax=Rhabditophanes sp. KR3021 TaxID=114890 RepID=A0AC35TMN3_9BILA
MFTMYSAYIIITALNILLSPVASMPVDKLTTTNNSVQNISEVVISKFISTKLSTPKMQDRVTANIVTTTNLIKAGFDNNQIPFIKEVNYEDPTVLKRTNDSIVKNNTDQIVRKHNDMVITNIAEVNLIMSDDFTRETLTDINSTFEKVHWIVITVILIIAAILGITMAYANHKLIILILVSIIGTTITSAFSLDIGKWFKSKDETSNVSRKCATNEVWRECSKRVEKSCSQKNPAKDDSCGEPRCQCGENFLRDSSNKCILSKNCSEGISKKVLNYLFKSKSNNN